jgi:hypothetical protein
MELTERQRALLAAAVRGEYGDIDFRYDGMGEAPELDELVELGLLTRHDGSVAYLRSYSVTPEGRAQNAESAGSTADMDAPKA